MEGLTLSISPCPNDTFMFDAMLHERVDTEGLVLNLVLEDVETLNRRVLAGKADVSKVSIAAFLQSSGYELLDSGAALGRGAGPLLVCKAEDRMRLAASRQFRVAIPGLHTTAGFLFNLFYPGNREITEMVFSEIEDAVLRGTVDVGVIIHESRFTYERKGLVRLDDLGQRWENETSQPIPLGGIAIRSDLPEDLKEKMNRVIHRSIRYAFEFPDASREFVKQNAQEMEDEVIRQHIGLYVNRFSVSLGNEGHAAVETFARKAVECGFIHHLPPRIFSGEVAAPLNKLRTEHL